MITIQNIKQKITVVNVIRGEITTMQTQKLLGGYGRYQTALFLINKAPLGDAGP